MKNKAPIAKSLDQFSSISYNTTSQSVKIDNDLTKIKLKSGKKNNSSKRSFNCCRIS